MKNIKILSVLAFILFALVFDLSAGNKATNRKNQRVYANRAELCKAEQYKIQSSGQTKYKKRNAWQPKQKKAIRKNYFWR
jgi:hypothetical protein